MVMQKKLPQTTITVPVPDHKEIRIGTLQSSYVKAAFPSLNLNLDVREQKIALRS